MSRTDGPDELRSGALSDARVAHQRHQYADAYRGLSEARHQGALPDDDLRLLADASWWLGRISEYLTLTEELHQRYLDQGSIDRAALQALDLGGAFFMRGEPAVGSAWLSRARRLLNEQPRGRGHGILLYVDVSDALAGQQLDVAMGGALELQHLGRDLADPTLAALGLLCEGLAEIRRGRFPEGFALLDEAMLPVVSGTVDPEFAGNIYCTIIAVCEEVADVVRAREWTEATERWLETFSDAVMFRGVCRAHRVHLLATVGDWDRAVAEAEQVLIELADFNQGAMAEAEYQLGEIHRLRDRPDAARAAYLAAARRGKDPQPGLALLEAATGQPDEAWAMIASAVASATGPFACARLLHAQVEIGLRSGRLDAARAAYQRLRDTSDTYASPGFVAWADRAEGALHLAEGEPAAAVAPLAAAAAGFHRMDCHYERADVEVMLAASHAALGNAGEAETHQEAAGGLFARLGLAVRPMHLAAPAVPAPGGLTEREVEVLARVAAGDSNRAVGTALSISEATVRRHLANIFRKLEVTSRTAAAAWAHRHGLGS